MVKKYKAPARLPVPGGKVIEEYVGQASTGTTAVSIAHMIAPPQWGETFQEPEFDEATVVVRGTIRVEHDDEWTDVGAGETVVVTSGMRIRYSNPFEEEAEYWAVCWPAFSPLTVHREE